MTGGWLVLVLIGSLAVLGACSIAGWTADSRDTDYSLTGVFATNRPAPQPCRDAGLRRPWLRLRDVWREQIELQERLALLNRPWEEDYLHWVGDGPDQHLHGHFEPPRSGRRYGVTRGGWCPGQAGERGSRDEQRLTRPGRRGRA